jgi:hypothetical protein
MPSKLIFLSFILCALGSANTLFLEPGEKVTLKPNEETTVLCKDMTVSLIDKFCSCIDPGAAYMKTLEKHYVFSNAKTQTVTLGNYGMMIQCEEAMAASPACK